MRKFMPTRSRCDGGGVLIPGIGKVYSQGKVMELLGITRPTYYKYVEQGKIIRFQLKSEIDVGKPRWAVHAAEFRRVKSIIDAGWVRGKAKFPKKAKGGKGKR